MIISPNHCLVPWVRVSFLMLVIVSLAARDGLYKAAFSVVVGKVAAFAHSRNATHLGQLVGDPGNLLWDLASPLAYCKPW